MLPSTKQANNSHESCCPHLGRGLQLRLGRSLLRWRALHDLFACTESPCRRTAQVGPKSPFSTRWDGSQNQIGPDCLSRHGYGPRTGQSVICGTGDTYRPLAAGPLSMPQGLLFAPPQPCVTPHPNNGGYGDRANIATLNTVRSACFTVFHVKHHKSASRQVGRPWAKGPCWGPGSALAHAPLAEFTQSRRRKPRARLSAQGHNAHRVVLAPHFILSCLRLQREMNHTQTWLNAPLGCRMPGSIQINDGVGSEVESEVGADFSRRKGVSRETLDSRQAIASSGQPQSTRHVGREKKATPPSIT